MISAVSSQIILKGLINELQPLVTTWRDIVPLLDAARIVKLGAAMLLLVAGYTFWVLCLMRLDLSWAYPVACTSVLFVVLFSVLFLGEPLTLKIGMGTVLILAGVILLAPKS